jgi:hypothetical protein
VSASSAAIEISRNMDLFNVIPLALVAYRFNCRPLINFCDIFLRNNLDGVLAVGMKNDFEYLTIDIQMDRSGGVRGKGWVGGLGFYS